jgi:hypothetical protein
MKGDAQAMVVMGTALLLLQKVQALGLTFTRGTAYISAAYIRDQEDLNRRINTLMDAVSCQEIESSFSIWLHPDGAVTDALTDELLLPPGVRG